MARVLAFVAAVAMVVGAIAVRNRIDDRPGLGTSGERRTLICATELANVCNAVAEDASIAVTIEPAGKTADRLKGADEKSVVLDAWLVPQPWPAIVDEARQRSNLPALFEAKAKALARSPLMFGIWADRAAALSKHCGRVVDMKCVSEAAAVGSWSKLGGQAAWGEFKPFVADPTQHASGLLAAAAVTAALTGRTDASSADLDEDEFSRLLDALVRAIPDPAKPSAAAVRDLLTQGSAALDVVIGTESELGPAIASSSKQTTLKVIYPSPVLTADLVLARRADGKAGRIADFIEGDRGKKVLAADGWRVPGMAPVNGVTSSPLPPSNGLPSAGLLIALQGKWSETSR